MIVDHDVHVHTTLSSCCRDERLTAPNVIARAARLGLKTLGFADHLWDRAVPGASDWYRPQDLEHVLRVRREIPKQTRGVRVLIGCETEYCGDGKVGISPEAAEELDFVLVPMSHLHMGGFTVPAGLDKPRDVARLMVQRFNEVVALGLATGIPHPFYPLGFQEHVEEILSLIPDAELLDCFGRAADACVSIEINAALFPGCRRCDCATFSDEVFLRVLTLARQAGCCFHFASDAHALSGMKRVLKLAPYAEAIGLTPGDVHPLFAADSDDPLLEAMAEARSRNRGQARPH